MSSSKPSCYNLWPGPDREGFNRATPCCVSVVTCLTRLDMLADARGLCGGGQADWKTEGWGEGAGGSVRMVTKVIEERRIEILYRSTRNQE
ncbi:hypothetical protein ElyMa_000315500 [Elysia marginata]|uniref:Uncharacterized protein n=1 Tax=Elysia marginata TaxID=1093978 RepID=A0AAV4FC86_9GAST|nr:hypothetical protein ElyMa_000315500 [Elysia marginata]